MKISSLKKCRSLGYRIIHFLHSTSKFEFYYEDFWLDALDGSRNFFLQKVFFILQRKSNCLILYHHFY